jgi:plasmid stabilization system protein ParE
MKYQITILRSARQDVRELLTFIMARSQRGASAWAKAYDRALARLERHADGCPVAAESEQVNAEIREVLFKTRRGLVYRILFTIRESRVFILHVRGPGQDWMKAEELHDDNLDDPAAR